MVNAMNTTNEIVEIAEQELKAHGVRVTKKRVNVFAILMASAKAVSAYELVDSYKETFNEPVPVVTVYRVLDFLQEKKLVHKLETANKFIVCSHINCDHQHHASNFLICKQCLKVTELSISWDEFKELKQTIEQAGFYINNPQLEMNCICNACHNGAA
jgi:Fe2+/Zn2+ uptake regulation proteins